MTQSSIGALYSANTTRQELKSFTAHSRRLMLRGFDSRGRVVRALFNGEDQRRYPNNGEGGKRPADFLAGWMDVFAGGGVSARAWLAPTDVGGYEKWAVLTNSTAHYETRLESQALRLPHSTLAGAAIKACRSSASGRRASGLAAPGSADVLSQNRSKVRRAWGMIAKPVAKTSSEIKLPKP